MDINKETKYNRRMNKFLSIYLSIVETIEVVTDNVINLILQPLYAVARIIISICDVWNINYEAETEEEKAPEENNKKTIGFKI